MVTKLKAITSQAELDQLLTSIDWEDAFIREVYTVYPTYLTEDHKWIVAPGADPDVKVLVFTPFAVHAGVEFLFEDVESLDDIHHRSDLTPNGKISYINYSVKFNFVNRSIPDLPPNISAARLFYGFVENDALGWKIRYGNENPFNEGGNRLL
jgi:hypothetical protein